MSKFKALETQAKDSPVEDIEWEGEELTAHSQTKLNEDRGIGQEIILRFFDFKANPDVFREKRPTAQQLFNSHQKGIESLLWTDGLQPYQVIEPRLLFSKDKKYYRFVISCIPSQGNTLIDKTNTLSELLAKEKQSETG